MRLVLLITGAVLSGCTATKATVHIVSAEQALVRATEHGAEELAPYEYTLSLRYLEKAREEAGYSDYKEASNLARKSADYADQAIISIEKSGKTLSVDGAGKNLTDSNASGIEILDEPEDSP